MNYCKMRLFTATFVTFFCISTQATFNRNGFYTPTTQGNPLQNVGPELRNVCTDPKNSTPCNVIAQALNSSRQRSRMQQEQNLLGKPIPSGLPLSTVKKGIILSNIREINAMIDSPTLYENLNQLLAQIEPQQREEESNLFFTALENKI